MSATVPRVPRPVREQLGRERAADLQADMRRIAEQIRWALQSLDSPDGDRSRTLAHVTAIRTLADRQVDRLERALYPVLYDRV